MDTRNQHTMIVIASAIVAIATLCGPSIEAQQAQLGSRYAKATLDAAQAIESDDPHTQAPHREIIAKIEELNDQAKTDDEVNVLKTIHAVYQRHLSDERLARAYQTLTEIDSDHDLSESFIEKKRKDSAVSQFADIEEAIVNRQQICFHELEQSLAQRSAEEPPSCAAWLNKGRGIPSRVLASDHTHSPALGSVSADFSR